MKKLFSQYDPLYKNHQLGTVAGTIGDYGCYECDDASVLNDSGHLTNPVALDELLVAKKLFVSGDLITDDVLDKLYPGEYKTTVYSGFRADVIKAAVPSPDTYVRLYISGYSPGWKMNIATHFVLAWTADGAYIGDPAGGVVRALSFYGGAANVHKTVATKRIKPAPVPVPTPKPSPTPPPPPVYSVVQGSAILATKLLYDAAVAQARTFAAGHVGQLFAVVDSTGATVDTEFVAPDPAPIQPEPRPIPTPLPGQTDFWALLDQFLIQIILIFKRGKQP